MSTSSPSGMHRDHREWESENALWRDQLREWQRENEQAVAELNRAQQVFRNHERTLETHAAGIRLFGQACAEHEHDLAAKAQAETPQACGMCGHEQEAIDHRREREIHERIKRRHHTLMAQLAMLMRSLTETV